MKSRSSVLLWACLVGLGLITVVAVTAQWLAPYDPSRLNVGPGLAPPSADHLLGTDQLGRDVFSRLLGGAQTAMLASVQAVAIAMSVGVSLGIAFTYWGGWWDRIGTRVADVMQSVPALLFALAFIAVFGAGLTNAMTAVGIVFIDSCYRVTRAMVLSQKEMLYMDAARVTGLPWYVVVRNLLPNIAGPLIVQGSVLLGVALLIESMLSFIGVGASPDQVSWGLMLDEARGELYNHPLLAIVPGIAITVVILLFNLTGDALGDRLSVRRVRGGIDVVPAPAGAPDPLEDAYDDEDDETASVGAERTEFIPLADSEKGDLLTLEGLTVRAPRGSEGIELVSSIGLGINRGEIYGLVGESGSGKSVTGKAIAGLLPPELKVTAGSIMLEEEELVGLPAQRMRAIRGARIAMVFQNPISSLSPTHTVGAQLVDAVRAHQKVSARAAEARARELLSLVGVPNATGRLKAYPHQFSGGMAQRVGIAAALASDPELLIADEPTTALDVTLQAQVLDLLVDLRDRLDMSVLLITHDMGVVASTCDRVAVMYAGQIVERRTTAELFSRPRHPYTEALLNALPAEGTETQDRLPTIPGTVPPAWDWPTGCRFHPRCEFATPDCAVGRIPMTDNARCIRVDELVLEGPAHER
ncbi:dipeptide/oligopeptide/nickel ABC transporter permease/ATP-binding protein [Georgenia sp. Z1491]|uniref:dipeptide/oligopeptide/nickel ABC transporter permease/ATP-binding protein n=1 Tax=Georgenia sp. Z1491 TaxID=3416707 RepID=UPI003CF9013E